VERTSSRAGVTPAVDHHLSRRTRLARDPPETGGECSDRLLHCEDGAEPGRSLDNALISLRSFGQRVGLDYRFNFSLGYVI